MADTVWNAFVQNYGTPKAAAPELPQDNASRWYRLSDSIAQKTKGAQMDQTAGQLNSSLQGGLNAIGQRGNNAAGSREALASGIGQAGVAGGSAAGTGMFDNLSQMYTQGLNQIELPTMQGADMRSAQDAAYKKQQNSGLSGLLKNFLNF